MSNKMVDLNGTLVNVDNICTAKRYYQTTKTPGQPDKKDYFRVYIEFIGGLKKTIEFDETEKMDSQFLDLTL